MIQVNVHEAKTHLSKLLSRVSSGEEIVISKFGKPIARLIPWDEESKNRVPGQDSGLFHVPDNFDAPLPEDILKTFES
jgi:prevent-host-death family protein